MSRFRLFLAPMALVVALVALAACGTAGDDDDDDAAPQDTPVSSTPGPQTADSGSVVWSAQMDLARRLDIDVLEVELAGLTHAGWDGCLGVREPDGICTEIFIGGLIATFRAAEDSFRYHIGGAQFIATDFLPDTWQVDDGLEVPADIQADMSRVLTAYTRDDLAHRLDIEPEAIVVEAVVPGGFSSSCIGFVFDADTACTDDLVPGIVVLFQAGGEAYRYHAIPQGIRATDFLNGDLTYDYDLAAYDLQQEMRADLAGRLAIAAADISVVSFREVTWPNGCLGVAKSGDVCTQALVEGFLAFLAPPDGQEYRYHATSAGQFTAADFVTGATISDPLWEAP